MENTTAGSVKDWPETRPWLWRTFATIDWHTSVSSLFGAQMDVILLYHSVGGIPGGSYPWDISTETFRRQVETLNDRFEIVDLGALKHSEPGVKRVAITFDDGFRNVFENALPILRENDLPATIFISPTYINDNNLTRLRERYRLNNSACEIVMTDTQITQLSEDPLFKLGNHTTTHRDLSTVTDAETLQKEITESKQMIEDRFDISVDRFAYPYGQFNKLAADHVRQTHELAVTSEPSLVGSSRDLSQLPRLDATQPSSVLSFETTDISHHLRESVRSIQSLSGGLI